MTGKIQFGFDSIETHEPTKRKKVLIAFSGGLDSLYLALLYLEKGWDVKLLQINTGVDALKKQKEQEALENIFRFLKERWGSQLSRRVHNTGITGFTISDLGVFQVQPLEWTRALVENLDADIDEVALGYLADDGITISVVEKIKALYELTRNIRWVDAHQPIKFPLICYEKSDIIHLVPLEYFNLFWTCETPRKSRNRIRPCLKCAPCKNLTSGMVVALHDGIVGETIVKLETLVKRGMVDERFFQPFLTKDD